MEIEFGAGGGRGGKGKRGQSVNVQFWYLLDFFLSQTLVQIRYNLMSELVWFADLLLRYLEADKA